MKTLRVNQKAIYILTCVLLTTFLFGCKEKGGKISVLDGLPDSAYFTEAKASLENNKPLIITFLAEWCPHCRKFKPTFFEVKSLFEDKVTFILVDVDDPNGTSLSGRFQVRGIPTTAFIRSDGSVFKVQVGGLEKEDLTKVIEDFIKSKKKRRREPIAPFPIEPQVVATPKEEAPQEIIKEEPQQVLPEAMPEENPTPSATLEEPTGPTEGAATPVEGTTEETEKLLPESSVAEPESESEDIDPREETEETQDAEVETEESP